MKYIVILGDGMSDEPIEELGGKTPLEVARDLVGKVLLHQGQVLRISET